MGRRKGREREKGSEGLKRMDDMGARGGKKSRVESEKRNRAEVRRTDSIVPWWNGERKRESSLCWVTIPLFGRAYADRTRYIPWQKCSSFLERVATHQGKR